MIYDFGEFFKDNILWFALGLSLLGIIICIISIKLVKKHKKHKKPKLKIDEAYVTDLINLFGGKENIDKIDVDGNKLKVDVKVVDNVDLNGIKEKAKSGVFVVNQTIKTLFMYDSATLKKELDKYKG
ncbi:MAG: hypothetical protein J6Y28_00765 [Acholeplasmatales bacterium]|nr:hypothetical protein [Acholeplasmatales bacterium]